MFSSKQEMKYYKYELCQKHSTLFPEETENSHWTNRAAVTAGCDGTRRMLVQHGENVWPLTTLASAEFSVKRSYLQLLNVSKDIVACPWFGKS